MMFTKADRDLLCELKAYLYGLRDGSYKRFDALDVGQDKLLQSHSALSREFEKIQGFIQNRVKPLTDEEQFDWAKGILFNRGYVAVMMEDARSARQGIARSAAPKVKPPSKSRKK